MENTRTSLGGYRLDTEIKNVPVSFVNALRRILLAEIPVVVVSNVEILDNTTSMTHEMLKHRMEMLPVKVKPEETGVIRDTKIELRYLTSPETREVSSDDFVITGPKPDVLLRDRDLSTPMHFLTLKPNESLHIKATLAVAPTGASHVCVSTFRNHIDADTVAEDRVKFISQAGEEESARREAAKLYDAFHIQRSFHRNKETQRPDWFDLTIESVGVMEARDLLNRAANILKDKIAEWVKSPILREGEGWYRMETEGETYTLGQLLQEVMYQGGLVEFVSRDIGHPLTPKLIVRFETKNSQPEAVIEKCRADAMALCENVLT
jgi:DNA-directed RNA polymerase subunit L